MKTKKYRETCTSHAFVMGGTKDIPMARVIEVPESEEPPGGATEVSNDTPVSDWAPVEED